MQAKTDAVRAKVAECIAIAERKFGNKMPNVQVRFDLRGRAAGVAGKQYGNFFLRFNVVHMNLGGKTWDHIINDTVAHEVAHLACFQAPTLGRNHDAGWQRVCIALGGNGQRCYSENDAPEAIAANKPYVYTTTNGATVRVSSAIHSRIQKGKSYRVRGGQGCISNECQYSYMDAAGIAASKKQVVDTPAAVSNKGIAKADLIRLQIAQGKSEAECVGYGVSILGMSRALAKTYYRNNVGKFSQVVDIVGVW